MSKEAALRAMREARYLERTSGATPARGTGTPAVRAASTKAAKAAKAAAPGPKAPKVAPEAATGSDGLCGHRSMNGRTCTREHGHEAKSHRYG